MARGRKIELDIGANIDAGWHRVDDVDLKETGEILEPKTSFLVFKREKRRGKTVTLVGPFQLSKTDASVVLSNVKKKLGCGGSYKGPWMEFQGECQKSLRSILEAEGFGFKH